MPKLYLRISMSLDGFVAGPDQSVSDPIGVGGGRLHQWVLPLAFWRSTHGLEGGERNASDALLRESAERFGATIMGRNMFGGHPGAWNSTAPWNGWWGDNPPFHHEVFVLTHHPREPLVMQGGTTFHFVTEGPLVAIERARRAAGGRDVMLGGGAFAARHYLGSGLVDEMHLTLVPTLLGAGERLFDGLADLGALALRRTVEAPGVTHLMFASV